MPGGGGGGSADTSGMEKATREANQLNREVFEQSVARGEPYYNIGTQGLRALADRMGLQGGTMQSEAQIREQLQPQFMTQQAVPEGLYSDRLGNQYTFDQYFGNNWLAERDPTYRDSMVRDAGLTAVTSSPAVLDTAGLDAAVQAQMAAQQQPEGFGGLLDAFSMENYQQDPGYLFRLAEGEKALERAAAARGQRYDPSTMKALQDYGQQAASQEFANAYNRYNIDQQNVFNRLANIAGIGQGQVAQLDQAGQVFAGNTSQNLLNMANAQAAADQARRSERSSMFGNLLGLAGTIGGAYLGGPAGASIGGSIGRSVGGGM